MMHPSGSHSAVEAPPALAGLTALVVDDESYLRDVVGAILRHHGMGVIAAESVPEAWACSIVTVWTVSCPICSCRVKAGSS
ncbi:MAG: hypothetical protein U1E76_24125 [Planctomycetota bacterium]